MQNSYQYSYITIYQNIILIFYETMNKTIIKNRQLIQNKSNYYK
jgi:hypothetical protein